MKIINFKGDRNKVTIETDRGIFIGYGDLLPDGFLVFSDSVTDAEGTPLTPEEYARLKAAGRTFLLENDMEVQLFFE